MAYDALGHIATTAERDRWLEADFVVPSVVYADASGALATEPCYLIGGWLNSVTNWAEFAVHWKAFLRKHCICYLHQTSSKKKHDYWKADPVLRDVVNGEAFDIIKRTGAISFVGSCQ